MPQNKLEVAAENNATSNNSSGSVASTQKNNQDSEKTSEAQVSFSPSPSSLAKIICCNTILKIVSFSYLSVLSWSETAINFANFISEIQSRLSVLGLTNI